MTAVVLDEGVPVATLGERDLAQPALEPVALVTELVSGVDRDPAHHRLREGQAHLVEDGQVPARPQPAREHQAGVLERQERIRAPPVVAVLLEPLEHAVRRVPRVEPDDQIERREHAEDQDRAPEPEDGQPGEVHERVDDERERRDQHAQQPGVAFPVPPRRRLRCSRGHHASPSSRSADIDADSFTDALYLSSEPTAMGHLSTAIVGRA